MQGLIFSRKGAKLAKFRSLQTREMPNPAPRSGTGFGISRLGLEVFLASFAPLGEKWIGKYPKNFKARIDIIRHKRQIMPKDNS
jgi:hypothetical protein